MLLMERQMPINLYNGVMATLHANPGVHCAHNILYCPPRFRTIGIMIIKNDRTDTSKRD